jgi:hypothetical protein
MWKWLKFFIFVLTSMFASQQLIAGVVAGMASTAAFYPLELLKTRMQVISGSNAGYKNVFASLSSVLKSEGFLGFYKGLMPGLIASAGSWGGYFLLYENSKTRKLRSRKEQVLGVSDHVRRSYVQ